MGAPTQPAAYNNHQHRLVLFLYTPLYSLSLHRLTLPSTCPHKAKTKIDHVDVARPNCETTFLYSALQRSGTHSTRFPFSLCPNCPTLPSSHSLLLSFLLNSSLSIFFVPFFFNLFSFLCDCDSLIMASRVALLLVMCVLPAMVVAIRPAKNPFVVKGRVFCDPCRAGFETSATTYIPGAEVLVQCKDRISNDVVYTQRGWTDSTGSYTILVNEDHADQVCDAKLVSSPQHDCKEATPGRDQARVILTGYNGIASNDRFANSIGFMTQEVASGCADILRQYQEFDDEN